MTHEQLVRRGNALVTGYDEVIGGNGDDGAEPLPGGHDFAVRLQSHVYRAEVLGVGHGRSNESVSLQAKGAVGGTVRVQAEEGIERGRDNLAIRLKDEASIKTRVVATSDHT